MTADALRRAVDALVALRADDGLWHGFPTLAGRSEHWVSGFVATHLLGLHGLDVDLTDTAATLLGSRHDDGGWGYDAHVPTDADSTAWCAQAVRRDDSATGRRAAREVLAAHRVGDGYATYRADSGIVEFVQSSGPDAMRGWTQAHPEVTAAVLLAGEPADDADAEAVLTALVRHQTGAGFLEAYWWRGPCYASALLLRALNARGRCLDETEAGLMRRGLARVQREDGGFGLGSTTRSDPFTTALGLEALCRLGQADARADEAAATLLGLQQDDGRWAGAHVMRLPTASVTDPRHVTGWQRDTGGGNSYVHDTDGLFATALSVSSLDLWQQGGGTGVLEPVTPPHHLGDDVEIVRAAGHA